MPLVSDAVAVMVKEVVIVEAGRTLVFDDGAIVSTIVEASAVNGAGSMLSTLSVALV